MSLKGARLRGGVLFVTVFAVCAAQFGVEARPLGRGRIKHVKRVATGGPGRSTVPVVRLKGKHRIRIVVRGRKSAAKTVR